MSDIDVGKDAKRKGATHPKHARRIDADPPRPTPAAKPRRKAYKPWGIAYELRWFKFSNGRIRNVWVARIKWYATERQRDQSLEHIRKQAHRSERYHEKVFREHTGPNGTAGTP